MYHRQPSIEGRVMEANTSDFMLEEAKELLLERYLICFCSVLPSRGHRVSKVSGYKLIQCRQAGVLWNSFVRATATEVNSNAGGPFDARGTTNRVGYDDDLRGVELHLQGGGRLHLLGSERL